ncbi:hypothetical protein ElyMa_004205300 [Elysia marginata]|uniref:Uncharacterized protein n=1 Tax=Elysia marginata TaxID=1093978 RepID=A0AAV4GN88_9GAST|nr:hypothetical protein ElyMa_004205300 [Elysia marginata]
MTLIIQYKKEHQSADSEDSSLLLLDKLNEFYARFDRKNTSTWVPCDNYDPPFLVTEQETKRAPTRLDVNGPDNIKLNRGCSRHAATSWHQSSPLFSFGLSLHQPYRYVSNSQQSYRCRRNLPWKQ